MSRRAPLRLGRQDGLVIGSLLSALVGNRGPVWGATLEVLRYVPSLDYRHDPGDVFAAVLEVHDDRHLHTLCRSLGIALEPWREPEPDVTARRIDAYPVFRQPKYCQVADAPAHVWVERDRLIIRVGGGSDRLSPTDYAHAKQVDARLGAVDCALHQRQLEHAWDR